MLIDVLLCLSVAENPFMTIISLFVQNALINNCGQPNAFKFLIQLIPTKKDAKAFLRLQQIKDNIIKHDNLLSNYVKIKMDVKYMKFDDNINKDEYIKFWKKNPNQHFLNSYWWGIVCQNNKNQIPKYVGLRDENNNIICETLLLIKETPLNMCYIYAPRGFLIDWNNKEIVNVFTRSLKDYMKKIKAIYLRVDPAVMYQEIDIEAKPIKGGKNNYDLFNYLRRLGYNHKGFYKLYEGNQPRYTFRTINTNYKSFDEIEKKISKSTMRDIKRSFKYNLKIELSGFNN